MPERGDTSRTLQTDQNRPRPRILAGGSAAGLEVPGGLPRIAISTRAGSNPLQTT
jgi:hypothetical protein